MCFYAATRQSYMKVTLITCYCWWWYPWYTTIKIPQFTNYSHLCHHTISIITIVWEGNHDHLGRKEQRMTVVDIINILRGPSAIYIQWIHYTCTAIMWIPPERAIYHMLLIFLILIHYDQNYHTPGTLTVAAFAVVPSRLQGWNYHLVSACVHLSYAHRRCWIQHPLLTSPSSVQTEDTEMLVQCTTLVSESCPIKLYFVVKTRSTRILLLFQMPYLQSTPRPARTYYIAWGRDNTTSQFLLPFEGTWPSSCTLASFNHILLLALDPSTTRCSISNIQVASDAFFIL